MVYRGFKCRQWMRKLYYVYIYIRLCLSIIKCSPLDVLGCHSGNTFYQSELQGQIHAAQHHKTS